MKPLIQINLEGLRVLGVQVCKIFLKQHSFEKLPSCGSTLKKSSKQTTKKPNNLISSLPLGNFMTH